MRHTGTQHKTLGLDCNGLRVHSSEQKERKAKLTQIDQQRRTHLQLLHNLIGLDKVLDLLLDKMGASQRILFSASPRPSLPNCFTSRPSPCYPIDVPVCASAKARALDFVDKRIVCSGVVMLLRRQCILLVHHLCLNRR